MAVCKVQPRGWVDTESPKEIQDAMLQDPFQQSVTDSTSIMVVSENNDVVTLIGEGNADFEEEDLNFENMEEEEPILSSEYSMESIETTDNESMTDKGKGKKQKSSKTPSFVSSARDSLRLLRQSFMTRSRDDAEAGCSNPSVNTSTPEMDASASPPPTSHTPLHSGASTAGSHTFVSESNLQSFESESEHRENDVDDREEEDDEEDEQLDPLFWNSNEFKQESEVKKKNRRKGKNEGVAIGTYTGGSIPFSEHLARLAQKSEAPVTVVDAFKHTKTKKHDGQTWIDPENAQLEADFVQLKQMAEESGLQVTDQEILFELVGGFDQKNRIKGVGDLAEEMKPLKPRYQSRRKSTSDISEIERLRAENEVMKARLLISGLFATDLFRRKYRRRRVSTFFGWVLQRVAGVGPGSRSSEERRGRINSRVSGWLGGGNLWAATCCPTVTAVRVLPGWSGETAVGLSAFNRPASWGLRDSLVLSSVRFGVPLLCPASVLSPSTRSQRPQQAAESAWNATVVIAVTPLPVAQLLRPHQGVAAAASLFRVGVLILQFEVETQVWMGNPEDGEVVMRRGWLPFTDRTTSLGFMCRDGIILASCSPKSTRTSEICSPSCYSAAYMRENINKECQ
ncbi:unnamed protein product [Cuscuta campestris]|uniref:Uncharacterized protein n=1 Tax=Cuscuta campestris TaxID=132261 RepID=A0A484N8T1_9ASTE|nr:unnamed protein product [Cuscuta campestris]